MNFYRGEAARLRAAGEKLGRDGLAARALEIAAEMRVDLDDYRRAIRGAGQLFAIAAACGWDTYWTEKADAGTLEELDKLEALAKLKEKP